MRRRPSFRFPIQPPSFVTTAAIATMVTLATAATAPLRADSMDDVRLELECGSLADLDNAYGPFDYTNPEHRAQRLPIVERHHFTKNVEFLVKGETGRLIGDLDYTLRAFPNHHRALNAVGRLELRDGLEATIRPATCYFDRALEFKPTDAGIYVVYGIYHYKSDRLDAAIGKLNRAVELAPESAEAHYNLGLLLHADGQYRRSSEHAAEARRLGYPLDGLIRKLRQEGHWPPDGENRSAQAAPPQPDDQ